jgi:hypothetical protein
MIQRAAGVVGLSGSQGNLNAFSDASQLSEWAVDAARFNAGVGILSPGGELRPRDNITRAETADLVYKLLNRAGFI